VFESEEPVTGIEFREGSITTLYIATTGRILTLVISGRGQGQPAKSLDEYGCGVGCMAVDKTTRDVVVARNDAIYYYGQHGRGPPYTYDGEKKMMTVFKDYVVMVAPPKTNVMPRSNPLRALGIGAADDVFNTSTLTLLNTELRLVAHQEQLSSQVKAVVAEWGDLFVLTMDGKVRTNTTVGRLGPGLNKFRSFDTMRSHLPKSSRSCTSEICIFWPLTWPRRQGSTLPS
jgi:hypothetical protein